MKGPIIYRGPDAVNKFCHAMENEVFDNPRPMIMNEEILRAKREAINCWACDKPLNSDRVMHHDHITGDFIGMTRNNCNLKMRLK